MGLKGRDMLSQMYRLGEKRSLNSNIVVEGTSGFFKAEKESVIRFP